MSAFEVVVPATLSNLGPGFDVLGMAISITNRFVFSAIQEARFEVDGKNVTPSHQLTIKTMLDAQKAFGGELPAGVSVIQTEDVPRSRGLGSSATSRVAGFVAWSKFTGIVPPLQDALGFVAHGEGHPDNAVPAMIGGLIAAGMVGDRVHHVQLTAPSTLRVALCIPDRTVQTAEARRALPRQYDREDVVFNTSRLAFMMIGLLQGNSDALSLGCEDRVHQPYRGPLIGPVDAALSNARTAGASCAFISGSGSTLAAFVLGEADPLDVARAMAEPFESAGVSCHTRAAQPVTEGPWPVV